MDKPWYLRVFSRSQPSPEPETSQVMANNGDAEAQFSMGWRCANSQGKAQDYVQAASWYLKAADQNHSMAQFNLGIMYAKGQGVDRDDVKSMAWFGRAANQGDAGAQFKLGMAHHRASLRGIIKDAPESRIEAYKWFQLAAAQGYLGSTAACDCVTIRMTYEDVTEGNNRVSAFAAVNCERVNENC